MTPRVNHIELADYSFIGYSLAGEETVIGVPELNVCFDIGRAPSQILNLDHVLLSHGHMDHAAGIAYYFSQRNFLDNPGGTLVAPEALVDPIHRLMDAWVGIEGHRTPYKLVGMKPGDDYRIRKDLVARAFRTNHGGPCLGYSIIETRRKLKEEYLDLTGPEIVELKKKGVEITTNLEVPLVCYCGDTAYGPFFDLPYVKNAKVLILECTFVEPGHRSRALAGNHMHLEDFVKLQDQLNNEFVLIVHLSRRTAMKTARKALQERLTPEHYDRLRFLMARPQRLRPTE